MIEPDRRVKGNRPGTRSQGRDHPSGHVTVTPAGLGLLVSPRSNVALLQPRVPAFADLLADTTQIM